jgi:hypothetical protein
MKKMFPADVYDSLCNLCLIRQGENSDISDQLPSEYLFATCEKKKLKKVLRSQLIPSENNSALGETSSSELKKSFPRFLKEREALIAEAFNREAGIKVVCEDW